MFLQHCSRSMWCSARWHFQMMSRMSLRCSHWHEYSHSAWQQVEICSRVSKWCPWGTHHPDKPTSSCQTAHSLLPILPVQLPATKSTPLRVRHMETHLGCSGRVDAQMSVSMPNANCHGSAIVDTKLTYFIIGEAFEGVPY